MGLSLFCYFQVGLVWEAHHRRALPPEPDDAYYYIFKTVQLRECFRQDCAALNDLRPQLTPSPGDSPSRAWKKWRLFHGFLVDYHPFYSLVLLLLSQVQGISLELAFWQLCLLGSLGLALTIAALLLTLTDVATAGVAMATLALTVFPGQGIHYIVPSNLTMGLGILMFVHLLRRDGRPGLLFYALNLGALGMHPTGLIYSGLGIVFGFACRYREPWGRVLRDFLPTLGMMGIYFLLIQTVTHPALKDLPQIVPPGTSYFREVAVNFKRLSQLLVSWGAEHGLSLWPKPWRHWLKAHWPWAVAVETLGGALALGSRWVKPLALRQVALFGAVLLLLPVLLTLGAGFFLAVLLARGFSETAPEKGRALRITLMVSSAALVAGCFYVLYRYQAELVKRLFIFWAVAGAAVFGRALVLMARDPGLGYLSLAGPLARYPFLIQPHPGLWRAALVLFLVLGYGPRLVQAYHFRSSVLNTIIARMDVALEAAQPREAVQQTTPQDLVLYDHELVLSFFLTHGGLHRGAVLLPVLPLPAGFKLDPANVKFLAAWNPYLELPGEIRYPLRLAGDAKLEIHLEPEARVEALEVLTPTRADLAETHLWVERQAAGRAFRQKLELSPGVWRVYPLEFGLPGGTLTLGNSSTAKPVLLAGLRLLPLTGGGHHWPWAGVREVRWRSPSASHTFAIPGEFSLQGTRYRLRVLADGAASVLWELTPAKPIPEPGSGKSRSLF